MEPGPDGVPGLPALVAVERDPEYEADLVPTQHQLTEVMTARETTPRLKPASTTESVSFEIVCNSVMLFLAVKR